MTKALKKYLIGGCSVSLIFFLHASTLLADECTSISTCEELGYTMTDCGEAPSLKCPFDQSKLFCDGGRNSDTTICKVGDIYYSDDTCDANVISGKTPIGIVFDNANNLVLSLDSAELMWGGKGTDVSQLANCTGDGDVVAKTDMNGKNNTDILASLGGYPAAEYCHNKSTGGKAWYLPAYGEIYSLYLNHPYIVNSNLSSVGTAFAADHFHWSSTELNADYAFLVQPSNWQGLSYKSENHLVRCIFKY